MCTAKHCSDKHSFRNRVNEDRELGRECNLFCPKVKLVCKMGSFNRVVKCISAKIVETIRKSYMNLKRVLNRDPQCLDPQLNLSS